MSKENDKRHIEKARDYLMKARNELRFVAYPLSNLPEHAYRFQISHAERAAGLASQILTDATI